MAVPPRLALLVLLPAACLVAAVGCAPGLGLGLATSDSKPLNAPVPASSTEPPPKSSVVPLSDRPGYGTDWCFDAGAPMAAPPAIGPEGQIYVATHEGYVHALTRDGAFRWSYTVKGSVIGGPRVLPNGRIVVATNAQFLYALTPSGTRQWVFRVPEPITTDLSVSRKGTLVLGAADRVLYAISAYGGVMWRAPIKGGFTTPPEVVADGLVALGTARGVLLVRGPNRQKLVETQNVRQVMPGPVAAGHGWALADPGILALSGSQSIELEDPRGLGTAGDELVAVTASEALWLTPQGQVTRRVPLPVAPSAGIALDAQGVAYAPTDDGWLLAAAPSGHEFSELARVGSSALSEPQIDEPRKRVVAAAGEGVVCAISFPDTVSKTGG